MCRIVRIMFRIYGYILRIDIYRIHHMYILIMVQMKQIQNPTTHSGVEICLFVVWKFSCFCSRVYCDHSSKLVPTKMVNGKPYSF